MQAARDVGDHAFALAAGTTAPLPPGERIRGWRRARVLALTGLDRAVILELMSGTTWEEAAEALMLPLDETIRRYGPVVERFRNRVATDLTIDVEGVGPVPYHEVNSGLPADTDPVGTAEAIDAWLDRHMDPWDTRGPRLAARLAP